MLIPHRNLHVLVAAIGLLILSGCGSGSQSSGSGNFGGTGTSGSTGGAEAIANVTVNPAQITGGDSTTITVNLTQPAPAGGILVQLTSSDASAVTMPASVSIPVGQSSATVAATTSAVSAAAAVAVTAIYGSSVAGTSLSVVPPASPQFTIALSPSTLTIAPGKSGSSKITTKVSSGYSHALTLSVSNVPTGVTVTLTPKTIPAPGNGTATAAIAVASTAATGTHSLKVTASDGKTTASATLTLKISSTDPGATFLGCWYKSNGNKYQGVQVSVANPGTYPFDADLYRGATCNPADQADEFGFGQEIQFGGFDYIFWFSDFKNQSNLSALWHVGKDTSACVNYEVAPDCP